MLDKPRSCIVIPSKTTTQDYNGLSFLHHFPDVVVIADCWGVADSTLALMGVKEDMGWTFRTDSITT